MHEEVMKLVPTFPQLISAFLDQPERFEAFVTSVSALSTIITKTILLIRD
jgi:hypothetical protein